MRSSNEQSVKEVLKLNLMGDGVASEGSVELQQRCDLVRLHPTPAAFRRKTEAPEMAAKAVCPACPVLVQCAAHSLAVREPYGVWGGMSEDEREGIYLLQRQGLAAAV